MWKRLALLGLAAVLAVPGLLIAHADSQQAKGQAELAGTSACCGTIVCPLTGEEIPECCCPLEE